MLLDSEKQALLKNQILVNNLGLYLARYPEDQKRIFDIVLRKIESTPKITGFEVPEPGTEYRARLCFIVSIMSRNFWFSTAKLWKADAYFIAESNIDAVALAFHTVDLRDAIANPSFHFFLGYQGEEIIAPLQRVLRQTAYAGKLYLSQVITPNADEGIEQRFVDYAKHFNELLKKTVHHVYFNFGNIDDSVEGLRATLANLPRIKHSGGIAELENLHAGKPFVVVGAGPSLDKDLDLLVKHQDKFIIIAVDASILPLHKAGCRIDYATTIERSHDAIQEKFFEGLPEMQTELIAFPVVHTQVINKWPGTVRFTYRNYAWYAYFEKHWPMGILESGGSASHLAAKLALHMGASNIYMIGCDMTYEKHPTEERYRSHCSSLAFPEWSDFKTPEQIANATEFYGFYDVEANDGSFVKTHTIYHQWAKEYAGHILASDAVGKFISTSDKGIKVPRMPFEAFGDVVLKHAPLESVEMKHPPNLRNMNLEMDHTDLIENIEGILNTFESCTSALTLMIDNPSVKRPEMYALARSCFYQKLSGDTFFTAFVIQNCAMEFFTTESKGYAVPEGEIDDDNYARRIFALYQLYQTVIYLCKKTVAVLKLANGEKLND